MSENLELLGRYSEAMAAGDEEAVFSFFAPDFLSHVTPRVSPEKHGQDIRGEELKWWTQARSAFPDMEFTVDLLIESDDLVVSNWTVRGTHTGTPFYDVAASGMPVEINGRSIGLFYADRSTSGRELDEEAFTAFRHFCQQANLALAYTRRGR